MKSNVIILLFVLFSLSSFSQEVLRNEVTWKAEITEGVIIEGKDVSTLYTSVKNWIQRIYKNPSDVIKGDIENEMIQGDGYAQNAIQFDISTSNLKYHFHFEIKDNKISIVYSDFEISTGSGYYSAETYLYKKNGDLKENSKSISVKEGIEKEIGSLIKSLISALN